MITNKIFQIVSLHEPHELIVRFKNFELKDIREIHDYISKELMDPSVNEVKITRWNRKTREREQNEIHYTGL